MCKQRLLLISLLTLVASCAIKPENPVDYLTYSHEPLVDQVKDGMSKQQVLNIGGTPSSVLKRNDTQGSCNNYVLSHDGHQQLYYVNFDRQGHVDSKGFMTCEQHQINENAL